jgi:hypothetical protein
MSWSIDEGQGGSSNDALNGLIALPLVGIGWIIGLCLAVWVGLRLAAPVWKTRASARLLAGAMLAVGTGALAALATSRP